MGLDVTLYKSRARLEVNDLRPCDDEVFDAGAIEIGYFRKWYAFVDHVFGSPTNFSYDAPDDPRNGVYVEVPADLIHSMIENPPDDRERWHHSERWLDETAPACLAAIADGWHIYMVADW